MTSEETEIALLKQRVGQLEEKLKPLEAEVAAWRRKGAWIAGAIAAMVFIASLMSGAANFIGKLLQIGNGN